MQTLQGRTCVFAGATAGDGIDTVRALCTGGMNVVLMTHNEEAAIRLTDEIKEKNLPGKCIYYTDGNDDEKYRQIKEKFGSIDVIISNTGGNGMQDSIETLEPEELTKSFDHLVGGSFRMLKRALPYLRESKAPRVIFFTTVEGCYGGTYESLANAVAKGAVKSLTLNCAARLAVEGITVNCIAKGAIPRVEGYPENGARPEMMLESIPMGHMGTPVDLANVICFLASEESSYITGQVIELSGGMQLGR